MEADTVHYFNPFHKSYTPGSIASKRQQACFIISCLTTGLGLWDFIGMSTVAIIAGSGVGELEPFRSWEIVPVETGYGAMELRRGEISGRTVLFTPRHGMGHTVPPHRINYKGIIAGLAKLGAERIIGTAAVGSLLIDFAPGTAAVLTDFIDFSRQGPITFFDSTVEGVVHTDFSKPYCAEVGAALLSAAEAAQLEVATPCTYIRADGPRYETPAEIAMFRSWGADVVGMTNVPEAVLSRELGICYGAIAIITNFAAGISPKPLSHIEVVEMMTSMSSKIAATLIETIRAIPRDRLCACGNTR